MNDTTDDHNCDRDCNPDTHIQHCITCPACAPVCQRLDNYEDDE